MQQCETAVSSRRGEYNTIAFATSPMTYTRPQTPNHTLQRIPRLAFARSGSLSLLRSIKIMLLRKAIFHSLTALIFFSFQAKADQAKQYSLDDGDEILKDLKTLTAIDGISESEANLLVTLYFVRYDGICGIAFPVKRKGGWWVSKTAVGPTGATDADIRVNVKFGHVFQRGRPTSIPPWKDLRTLFGESDVSDEKNDENKK